MPIYEYKCGKCDHFFERLARNSEDHPAECPSCHAPSPKKQFSAFSPAMRSSADEPCASAAECPAGACCSGGSCSL